MSSRLEPLQGLKPDVNLVGVIGTTEVVPFYNAFENCRTNESFRSLYSWLHL